MIFFLKRLLLFVVFAIPVYLVSVLLWGWRFPQSFKPNIKYVKGGYGYTFSRLKEIKQLDKGVDILFLGSSHAYRGFDPRNFPGMKTFNLGSNSQTPIQTDLLLQRYLDKVTPKMIIYEVFPNGFCIDGVESALDIISNDKNDIGSVIMAFKINDIPTYNTLIYSSWCEALHLYNSFSEPVRKQKFNDTYIRGGYVEKDLQQFSDTCCEPAKQWEFRREQIKAFEKTVTRIKTKKIELVLVYAPVTSSFYHSYINNQAFDSLMNTYNVSYYNFNELMHLNDSLDFYDKHHLNRDGVAAFNKELKHHLK
ncbi:hypothetical protein [Agriterribacter sp.]|uniref:hypothetical protein n=1 Tax=Agriterribacter sp. TaxID=2821509 RepID=UPI002C75C44E|nr:hypothetical protein [Agriterribacter sp.]HRO44576.1 hypothetical protein [Agriterribacter sp.]HRQ16013.1 hypothetical protein [Agriterribacter sp.]